MGMKPFEFPIYVNKPYLPPLDDFVEGLKEIWETKWLSNNGPVLRRLEAKLADFFQTDNISLFNNGTLALQVGLQGLEVRGDVITTPFTFVATSNALIMNGLNPVFCDVEPDYFTLDPEKVEASITSNTSAILAVHPFGYPCKLELLEKIAQKHGLLLIYDAAHAFGVKINGEPIAKFGDVSMLSFHATKPFHTAEGGALVYKNKNLKRKFDCLKNHGIERDFEAEMVGTNAKMNELQALMGEKMLGHFDWILKRRRQVQEIYRKRLADIEEVQLMPELPFNVEYNHSFMPIQISNDEFGMSRDTLCEVLKRYNVFARRYFSPLIPDLKCYSHVRVKDPLVNARKVASRILALPLYADLGQEDVHRICDIIDFLFKGKRLNK